MKTKSFLQLQAYNYIKEKILSHEFVPDTLYSETKLAAEVGVSRTPMREALQCLSQDGYITVVASKGFQIRKLTDKDMLESIQVRCAIEGYCTTVIAQEVDTPKGKKFIARLGEMLHNMEKSAEEADKHESEEALEEFMGYDHNFHLMLVEYVDNDEFNQLFQRLMYMIKLTSNTALSKKGRVYGTLEEHANYYNALKAGDSNLAYQSLIKHLYKPIEIKN